MLAARTRLREMSMSHRIREWECPECRAGGRIPIGERIDTIECHDCGLGAVFIVEENWLVEGCSVRTKPDGPLDAPLP